MNHYWQAGLRPLSQGNSPWFNNQVLADVVFHNVCSALRIAAFKGAAGLVCNFLDGKLRPPLFARCGYFTPL